MQKYKHEKSLEIIRKSNNFKAFRVGGEGEIRTLEPCYRLHDFQSCALDQLGDFSKCFLSSFDIISYLLQKSKSFLHFRGFAQFFKSALTAKGKICRFVNKKTKK